MPKFSAFSFTHPPLAAISRGGVLRTMVICAALILCGPVAAQGGPPGGGGGGGFHGKRSSAPGAERRPLPEAGRRPEPLEALLRAARELRQPLLLDVPQTQRWSLMLDDLRDAIDKRKALELKLADDSTVPNPALLYVQDMASNEAALASALDRSSTSMQAAFETLNERQRKLARDTMTAVLQADAVP
jgi:hypothetical protein